MKKLFRLLPVICAALFLSGCMHIHLTLNVDSKARVKETMRLLYQEKYMSQMSQFAQDSNLDSMLADLQNSFQEQFPDAKITVVKEGEGDDAYAGVEISGYASEEGTYTCKKENNTITLEIPVNGFAQSLAQLTDMENSYTDFADLRQYGVEALITVYMPGQAKTNAGSVRGRQVTIDMLDLPSGVDTVTITCKTVDYTMILMIIAAAILGGAIGFAKARRKG